MFLFLCHSARELVSIFLYSSFSLFSLLLFSILLLPFSPGGGGRKGGLASGQHFFLTKKKKRFFAAFWGTTTVGNFMHLTPEEDDVRTCLPATFPYFEDFFSFFFFLEIQRRFASLSSCRNYKILVVLPPLFSSSSSSLHSRGKTILMTPAHVSRIPNEAVENCPSSSSFEMCSVERKVFFLSFNFKHL